MAEQVVVGRQGTLENLVMFIGAKISEMILTRLK
jgi:hypothetical protein